VISAIEWTMECENCPSQLASYNLIVILA